MRNNGEHKNGLREYLDKSGVLVNGTEEEIAAARRAYRKQYLNDYKKQQRQENPEFALLLSKNNGEHEKIIAAARRHKMSVPTFLKMVTIAYLNKTFLVPDREIIGKLAQLLSDCLNEVQGIASEKGKYSWQLEGKYDAIEKRIIGLERDMRQLFAFPISIENAVREAVLKDPTVRLPLLESLIHDRKD
jgi:hypothetical protein